MFKFDCYTVDFRASLLWILSFLFIYDFISKILSMLFLILGDEKILSEYFSLSCFIYSHLWSVGKNRRSYEQHIPTGSIFLSSFLDLNGSKGCPFSEDKV